MSKEPYPSETADRFIVRFPDGMRDRIKEAAAENNRSMNAEIISRLEASFVRQTLDLNEAGLAALLKRLEATAEGFETLFRIKLDEEVTAYIEAEKIKGREISRNQAVRDLFYPPKP